MSDDVQNVPEPAEQPTTPVAVAPSAQVAAPVASVAPAAAPVAPVPYRRAHVTAVAVAAVVIAFLLSAVSFGAGVFVGRATNRPGLMAGPPPMMLQQGGQGQYFQGGPMGGGQGFDGGEQRGPRGGMRGGGIRGGMRGAPGQLPTATPAP